MLKPPLWGYKTKQLHQGGVRALPVPNEAPVAMYTLSWPVRLSAAASHAERQAASWEAGCACGAAALLALAHDLLPKTCAACSRKGFSGRLLYFLF